MPVTRTQLAWIFGTTIAAASLAGAPGCGSDPSCEGSDCKTGGAGGGIPPGPPQFEGLRSISPASKTSLFLVWPPARDDTTAAEDIRYAVYLSKEHGKQKFDAPDAETPKGAQSYELDGLDEGTTYFAVVRAIDADDNEDDNTVEQEGKPAADTKAPTFSGASAAKPASGGKVEVSWKTAKDNLTTEDGLRYTIWVSETAPVVTTGKPAMTTTPGALSAALVLPIPGTSYRFVVRALDAAGNMDANTKEVVAVPGKDTAPPTFAGCASAKTESAGEIEVKWGAATDDTTPDDQVTFVAYAFDKAGPHTDFKKAVVRQTFPAKSKGGVVSGLHSATKYFLVCRAIDLSENEDENTKEVSATTETDTKGPEFDGVTDAVLDTPDTHAVKLSWNAASDDKTNPAKISYDVYFADDSGAQDFDGVPLGTFTGTTSGIVQIPGGTTGYFVVRARDLAGNTDKNDTELTATTQVSFAGNIQPALSSICVICHSQTGGQYPQYDPGFAYQNIIDAGVVDTGDPPTSALYTYTFYEGTDCPYMPYGLCANKLSVQQVQWILDWITQGAQDN